MLARGRSRIQYKRKVNVIPETATEEEATAVFKSAWSRGRETVSGSYDDAGIGDLDSRAAVLYGILDSRLDGKEITHSGTDKQGRTMLG